MQCGWVNTECGCVRTSHRLQWFPVWRDPPGVSSRILSAGRCRNLWWRRCTRCRWWPAYSRHLCLPCSSAQQRRRWKHPVFCRKSDNSNYFSNPVETINHKKCHKVAQMWDRNETTTLKVFLNFSPPCVKIYLKAYTVIQKLQFLSCWCNLFSFWP